jgi:long-subunit fatty acid transport protein
MRKITVNILMFIVLLSLDLNAQSLLPIKYGIKVGSNISNFTSTPNDGVKNIDNSSLTGISGGFYMEIPLNDIWYLNPELIYVQKGADFVYSYTYNYPPGNGRDEYTTANSLKLTYVELNPTFSYKAGDKIALNLGPSVAFMIGVDSTFTDKLISESTASETPKSATYESESLDLGFNLGVSYYMTDDFLFEFRVSTGIMSIGKVSKVINPGSSIDNPIESNIYDLKNRGFMLTFAYLF